MKKTELLKLINDIEDNADIDTILQETEVFKNGTSLEAFKTLVSKEKEFIGFMDSEKDKHSEKAKKTAIENFKEKDMKVIIESEVAKRTGKTEKTALEIRIEELEARDKAREKELAAAQRVNKYKDVLASKGLNEFAENILIFEDDEAIEAAIDTFSTKFETIINSKVESIIKGGGRVPPTGGADPTGMTKEQFRKLSLGKQQELAISDKDLYAKMTEIE